MILFYIIATVSIWLGLLSLRNGIRFSRLIERQLEQSLPDYTPVVSVIAPCRGVDQGFHQNVAALLQQNYPKYELLFVTDKDNDHAVAEIERTRSQTSTQACDVRLLIAGAATDCGQKVHNLRYATERLALDTEVLVFVDSDARPDLNWLRSLVAPLANDGLGATTGYRWFVPVNGGIASHLRSVWNASIASALGEDTAKNFCWGGSTAIARSVFESLRIRDHWRGSVSDDFTITRVLRNEGLPVHFVAVCLVPSFEDASLTDLLTFSNRQLQITRTYAPHLWKPLFIGSLIFILTFLGGISIVVGRWMAGVTVFAPLLLLITVFVLGALKSFIRFQAVKKLLSHKRLQLSGVLWHVLLWPLASLLQLINCTVAGLSRRITWRGITYELKSPNETVIIARD
jgi:ceramide glucosyltransferase